MPWDVMHSVFDDLRVYGVLPVFSLVHGELQKGQPQVSPSGTKLKSPKDILESNNYIQSSTNVCRNDVWELFEINRTIPLIDHLGGTTKTLLGHLCLDTLLANLFVGALLGNRAWEPVLGNLKPVVETCPWKPVPANLAREPILETGSWKPCLGTLLANLFLTTLLGNPS